MQRPSTSLGKHPTSDLVCPEALYSSFLLASYMSGPRRRLLKRSPDTRRISRHKSLKGKQPERRLRSGGAARCQLQAEYSLVAHAGTEANDLADQNTLRA